MSAPKPLPMTLPVTLPAEAARYRRAGIWGDATIFERFRAAADRFPAKIAVRDAKAQYTYAELRHLIDNLAGHLLRLGIRKGEVVALQAPNWAELALLHLAANRIGALYLSLNDHHGTCDAEVGAIHPITVTTVGRVRFRALCQGRTWRREEQRFRLRNARHRADGAAR
jgi:non-ribosomal peptide synthetase component E (peptide arylation enzyme)